MSFPLITVLHGLLQVFAGAMLALAAMTVLSALMGWAAPNLVSLVAAAWCAVGLTGLTV